MQNKCGSIDRWNSIICYLAYFSPKGDPKKVRKTGCVWSKWNTLYCIYTHTIYIVRLGMQLANRVDIKTKTVIEGKIEKQDLSPFSSRRNCRFASKQKKRRKHSIKISTYFHILKSSFVLLHLILQANMSLDIG